jgi:hypothetical protein
MSTEQFLEYLQTHPATHALGDALASIRTARRRTALVPSPVRVPVERGRVSRSA